MAGPILESAANVARMKREGTVEPVDRIRLPVANPEVARAVERIAKLGAAQIKMHTTPNVETFRAAAAGEFVASGVRSAEHGLAFGPIDKSGAERDALFAKMVRADVWVSTTPVNVEGSILVIYPGFSPHDEMKIYVDQPNPLDDITHTRRMRGVMAAGRWFDRAALDRLLSEAVSAQ